MSNQNCFIPNNVYIPNNELSFIQFKKSLKRSVVSCRKTIAMMRNTRTATVIVILIQVLQFMYHAVREQCDSSCFLFFTFVFLVVLTYSTNSVSCNESGPSNSELSIVLLPQPVFPSTNIMSQFSICQRSSIAALRIDTNQYNLFGIELTQSCVRLNFRPRRVMSSVIFAFFAASFANSDS